MSKENMNLLVHRERQEQEGKKKNVMSEDDIQGKLDACCTNATSFGCGNQGCHNHGVVKEVKPHTCGIAICEKIPCLKNRINKRRRKYIQLTKNYRTPKFLTLTLKGYHPLKIDVKREMDRMWKTFSQWCRRRGYWWSYMKTLEIEPHDYCVGLEYKTVYFYHFHIIYDGKYVPVTWLSKEWLKITKDSYIVWIQGLNPMNRKSRGRLVNYVTKYVSKSAYLELEVNEYLPWRKTPMFMVWRMKKLKILYEYMNYPRVKMYCLGCDEELIYLGYGEWDGLESPKKPILRQTYLNQGIH